LKKYTHMIRLKQSKKRLKQRFVCLDKNTTIP